MGVLDKEDEVADDDAAEEDVEDEEVEVLVEEAEEELRVSRRPGGGEGVLVVVEVSLACDVDDAGALGACLDDLAGCLAAVLVVTAASPAPSSEDVLAGAGGAVGWLSS